MRERATGHGAGGTGTAVEYLSPRRAVRLHGRSSLSSMAFPVDRSCRLFPRPVPPAPCPVT